jgi:hypothetical protein
MNTNAPTPDDHKKVADALVQLGMARGYKFDDATNQGDIIWTADGEAFRRLLIHSYDKIADGQGKQGVSRWITLLTWIIHHR